MQSHIGPVLAASISMNSYVPYLIVPGEIVLLVSSIYSGFYIPSASFSVGFPELWWKKIVGDIPFRDYI